MKRINYLWIFLFLAGVTFGVWDNTEPADSTQWNVAAGFIRANNNALEVVLGIDLSMEGSASPWFQATTPTTVADGSTALTAANDGLLWIDSDTRILTAYLHGTGFVGLEALGSVITFTAADATPTVTLSSAFTTDSGALTITDFDDGTDGKVIVILSKGAVVYDTTTAQDADHNLDGSTGDITTASGDVTMWRNEGGNTWHLIRWNDASIDNFDVVRKTYVDTQDDAHGLQTSGATVFNTSLTAANTFQDLDVSGTVGSNSAVVFFQVSFAADAGFYVIKGKGAGSATFGEHFSSGGATSGTGAIQGDGGSSNFLFMTAITDSSGVLSHGFSNNTRTIEVIIRGFIAIP